jgi:hypothetical protein
MREGQSVSIDAKQRVILNKRRDPAKPQSVVVCAEPSPDVFSALSAAFAAEIEVAKELAAKLAGSQSEAAASIGLRTQSITLLRDGMYRLCEAYLNESVSAAQYHMALRRYQALTVGLLAIEQLTGVVRASQAIATSVSTAEVNKALYEAEKGLADAQDEQKTKSDASDAAKAALEKATTDTENAEKTLAQAKDNLKKDPNNVTLQQEVKKQEQALKGTQDSLTKATEEADAATKGLEAATAAVERWMRLRDAAHTTSTASRADGAFSRVPRPPTLSSGAIRYIAEATGKMVTDLVTVDVGQEICLEYLSRLLGPNAHQPPQAVTSFLDETCRRRFFEPGTDPKKERVREFRLH